ARLRLRNRRFHNIAFRFKKRVFYAENVANRPRKITAPRMTFQSLPRQFRLQRKEFFQCARRWSEGMAIVRKLTSCLWITQPSCASRRRHRARSTLVWRNQNPWSVRLLGETGGSSRDENAKGQNAPPYAPRDRD